MVGVATICQPWAQDQLRCLSLELLRLLKDGVYRLTKPQMPRQRESQTALPFYVADTIDADDPALKTPG